MFDELIDPEIFAMAFYPIRRIIFKDVNLVDGIYLEEIQTNASGRAPAAILAHRNWSRLFFLQIRPLWDQDQYFAFAEERQKALGITEP